MPVEDTPLWCSRHGSCQWQRATHWPLHCSHQTQLPGYTHRALQHHSVSPGTLQLCRRCMSCCSPEALLSCRPSWSSTAHSWATRTMSSNPHCNHRLPHLHCTQTALRCHTGSHGTAPMCRVGRGWMLLQSAMGEVVVYMDSDDFYGAG